MHVHNEEYTVNLRQEMLQMPNSGKDKREIYPLHSIHIIL